MANGDWDRDLRGDFAVSYIEGGACLVLNRTREVGASLAVRLRARRCARDAVGAIVTVVSTRGARTAHLVAGGGYLAANENLLLFGLGGDEVVETLTVRWPSGSVDEFESLSAGQEVIVVEGGAVLLPVPD